MTRAPLTGPCGRAMAVVVFENALVCYSVTVAHHHVVLCNVVLSIEFAPSLDYPISFGKSRQNDPSSLVASMPQRIAVFVSDCLRLSMMNITVSRLASLVSPCESPSSVF